MLQTLRFAPLACLIAMTGCVVIDGDVRSTTAPIVDGTLETGRPEVVYLVNFAGGACTATIISPRVALTAKHCVQDGRNPRPAAPGQFRLFVGTSASRPTAQYTVSEVRVAPGSWELARRPDGSDVAVLILSSAARETPREVSYEPLVNNSLFTAVGYGQIPSGEAGTKYFTEKRIDFTRGSLIFVRPSVCQGDSGGPLIGEDDRVYGVASFIYSETGGSPRCGTAPGAYNSLVAWRSLIEDAIEDSGACIPREEICNNVDDNCDGTVDEGCTELGEFCTSASECAGGACEELSAGRVCTQACDPLRPDVGCPGGFFCQGGGGCGGFCAARGTEELPFDADCTDSSQCISLLCTDPGDGRQRCLAPCQGDAGLCLAGEVCAALPDACGACVPAGLVAAPRGLGEPCDEDTMCRSAICFEDEGTSYCSRECTGGDEDECGDGYHCRGDRCARGPLEDTGGGCVSNEDCGSGFCATRGTLRWCTTPCAEESECPEGFTCTMVDATTSVCDPVLSLVGESCTTSADCASGLCASGTPNGSVCTRTCGPESFCSAGFECERIGGGVAACIAPVAPETDGGGCSTTRGSSSSSAALLFGLALLGLVLRRRR